MVRNSSVTCEDGSVADPSLRILTVSTSDLGGGAERVAWNLFNEYRARGYQSNLAVGYRRLDDPDILELPNQEKRSRWSTLISDLGAKTSQPKLKRISQLLAEPIRVADQLAGLDVEPTQHHAETTFDRALSQPSWRLF
jgi:hypothetical protein